MRSLKVLLAGPSAMTRSLLEAAGSPMQACHRALFTITRCANHIQLDSSSACNASQPDKPKCKYKLH